MFSTLQDRSVYSSFPVWKLRLCLTVIKKYVPVLVIVALAPILQCNVSLIKIVGLSTIGEKSSVGPNLLRSVPWEVVKIRVFNWVGAPESFRLGKLGITVLLSDSIGERLSAFLLHVRVILGTIPKPSVSVKILSYALQVRCPGQGQQFTPLGGLYKDLRIREIENIFVKTRGLIRTIPIFQIIW